MVAMQDCKLWVWCRIENGCGAGLQMGVVQDCKMAAVQDCKLWFRSRIENYGCGAGLQMGEMQDCKLV